MELVDDGGDDPLEGCPPPKSSDDSVTEEMGMHERKDPRRAKK